MQLDGSNMQMLAKGVRNSVGMVFHPTTGELWFTDNGRDNWENDHENMPPDEVNRVWKRGLDFGFPLCYGKNIPDPEFNKDKDCSQKEPAALELNPHVAALGLRFYTGSMFPAEYQGDLFVAEHGSWNRQPPLGYGVTRVRMNGSVAVSRESFISGWLDGDAYTCDAQGNGCPGSSVCQNNVDRGYAPPFYCSGWGRISDIQFLPDGSMLISDDQNGVIYRVTYSTPTPWYKNAVIMIALVIVLLATAVIIFGSCAKSTFMSNNGNEMDKHLLSSDVKHLGADPIVRSAHNVNLHDGGKH
jgi:hypothetical protein